MFRRKRSPTIEITKLSSLVAHNMAVDGDIVFEGGLRVDGRVAGNVTGRNEARGLLVLSDKGVIAGAVKVYDAVINGRVDGDIEVEHFLELQANAACPATSPTASCKWTAARPCHGKLERNTGPNGTELQVVALLGHMGGTEKGS